MTESGFTPNSGEIKPCMSCFAPNDIDAVVCQECGLRFGDSDVLQPLNVARAEGQVYQNLALGEKGARRPKFVILLGVWVIFLPLLIIGIGIVISQILDLNGFVSFVFICIGGAAIYFSLLMLGRVTRRYFAADEKIKK
jgi:hypothetical protein